MHWVSSEMDSVSEETEWVSSEVQCLTSETHWVSLEMHSASEETEWTSAVAFEDTPGRFEWSPGHPPALRRLLGVFVVERVPRLP